jgi:hypothetical protein
MTQTTTPTTIDQLDYGYLVETPLGDGTIVGFHRAIDRVLVVIPGIYGGNAIKTADVKVLRR